MVPKFRAWDKKTKEYFHISELWNSGTNPECFNFDGWTDNFGNNGRLKDIVIEQSTSMKDANGKEIYEGDIVKSSYKYAQPKISQVIMEYGNSYILGEDLATGNEMLVSDYINEIEVVGNVHMNLDLLEAHHE
ncbi:putative sensor protein [Lactobacillus phage LBR48]|uniref:Putative sensor protein n=1 Tax=Lactobacillus phage LBR48 TaxID=755164 RepID=D6PSV5_9CAUD|nr:putative sensor protein [Lactobacillus phage LBR48]ADF83446.1 putative sensor protein [Lactobacillus phage LBR48]